MRKYFFILLLFASVVANAQIYIYPETAGKNIFYGFTQLSFRPQHDYIMSYTTLQHGVTNWLDLGIDMTASGHEANMGFLAHVGHRFNNWIGLGAQFVPSFDLNDKFKFNYITNLYMLDGALTPSGNLWWASNTWHTILRNGDQIITNWWYLGYNIKLAENHALTPTVGVYHSWRFDEPADMAFILSYSYKWLNVYANLSELLPGRNVKGDYMPQISFVFEVFIPTK